MDDRGREEASYGDGEVERRRRDMWRAFLFFVVYISLGESFFRVGDLSFRYGDLLLWFQIKSDLFFMFHHYRFGLIQ